MTVTPQSIPDVLLIEPKRFGDHRGFFSEVYNRDAFHAAGVTQDFVQDNHSLSADVGTVRGLHFQRPPHAQAKLIRVVRGAIRDIAVDIRRGSPTFGQHVSVELSAENWQQVLVPRGFAHGFVTLTPDTEVLYKCDNLYAPDADAGLAWDDPALAIDWSVTASDAVLSKKDTQHPTLADLDTPFTV
jgi:dTDP-4-dehydrorhamnose 3,5-epimerase